MKKILLIGLALVAFGASAYVVSNKLMHAQETEQAAINADTNTVRVPGKLTLDLSYKNLDKIPADVFDRINLEVLNVSNNKLTGAIQSQLGQLKNLKVLNASNNQMTGVPAEIGQLQNLQVLDLSNNKLTGLPNELGNLKNLKTLNLSGNQYSTQDLDGIRSHLPSTVNIIVK